MHEDKENALPDSFLERIRKWRMVRKTLRKTRENIRHGRMMVAFYEHLEAIQQNKEMKGKIGMKVVQLEDSVEQEERFLKFIAENEY